MQAKTPPFIREPADVYREKRSQFLTSHQLIDFRKCPLLYKKKKSGLIAETLGDHLLVGSATHCQTLEGRQEFERQYIVGGPINPKTDRPYGRETKAYAEWAAEQGKPCLSDEQYALCCQLACSVRAHSEAAKLLKTGTAEGVLRCDYAGMACQIRVDWFNSDYGLSDLKTCDDLDKFEDDAVRYWYIEQMAFYQAIIAKHIDRLVPVHLIAVEKREPYRVGVWLIADEDLRIAESHNFLAVRCLDDATKKDNWPTWYEETRLLKRKAA